MTYLISFLKKSRIHFSLPPLSNRGQARAIKHLALNIQYSLVKLQYFSPVQDVKIRSQHVINFDFLLSLKKHEIKFHSSRTLKSAKIYNALLQTKIAPVHIFETNLNSDSFDMPKYSSNSLFRQFT